MRLTRFDGVTISATGHHLPATIVDTADMGLSAPDDLVRLTGVRRRHVAAPAEATSDLVIAACRKLAGPDGAPVDHATTDRVIVATVTPDHPSPATAPLVQHALGLDTVPALDVGAACSGFVFALDLAARAVLTGDRQVLVAAGECRTRTLAAARDGVRVLFGDGAAAALVTRDGLGGADLTLAATMLGADGRGHADVRVEAGGSRLPASIDTVARGQHALAMHDGPHVFFRAVEGFVELARRFLDALAIEPASLDLIVPHQPNLRILERVARLLRVPLDRFALEIAETGNLGGASVGVALDRAWRAGRIGPGARVLLLTAGAGYTAGAALLVSSSGTGATAPHVRR